jgi:hypothetical protein
MDLPAHMRNRKFAHTFQPSPETRNVMERVDRQYREGKLYGDDLLISTDREVVEAVAKLAEGLASDLTSHLDVEFGGDVRYKLLYR